MNWYDIVMIAIVVVGALLGMRLGLIGAAIIAAGALVGWLLAGQFADDLGGLFGDSLSADRWGTVVAYVVIVVLGIAVANIVRKFVRPLITVATAGLAMLPDKLGGLALGVVLGVLVSAAFIVASARFAYDFELPEDGVGGSTAGRVPDVEETKERVEEVLAESAIVPVFIDVVDAIPADTFGFVPSYFRASLEILEEKIE